MKTVNLDEYKGLTKDNDQSYYYFMHHHLFDRVNINPANTNVPNGMAEDGEAECQRYEDFIGSLGGVDCSFSDWDETDISGLTSRQNLLQR